MTERRKEKYNEAEKKWEKPMTLKRNRKNNDVTKN